MNTAEAVLWKKVEVFRFDDPSVDFSFSDRLARDNGWSEAFAKRVVEEYRKFIFMCCSSSTGVTPSDIVDQAWHLHLTYTKSYWVDLCRETLGKEIHHNPTKGGKNEAKKFDEFYTGTLKQYKIYFGHDAPEDIWQANEVRFSDIDFQRVNMKRYWLIKKPAAVLKNILALALFLVTGIILIQANDKALAIGAFCMVFGIILIAIIRNWDNIRNTPRSGDGGSGCTSGGCSSGHHGGHGHGDSGCNSGCSGCSSSGCSGCGGGD